jgi:hypothetical protein
MLCGPITFNPTDTASPPRVWCEIIGYFKNRQELAELLAKMSAAHDAPAAHSSTFSPDPHRKGEGKSACACLHMKAHHHAMAKCPIRRDAFSTNRRHHVSPFFVFASAESTSLFA